MGSGLGEYAKDQLLPGHQLLVEICLEVIVTE